MKQTLIGKLTAALGLVAIGAITYALASSMRPSERANANRPSVPMPILEPGQYVYTKDPRSTVSWPSDLLFVRRPDGKLKVWEVPLAGNEHRMPDIHWWQNGPKCSAFRPNFNSRKISCEESTWGQWASRNYQWDLDGKNIAHEGVDDMMAVDGEEEAGQYVLYKKK